MNDRRITNSLLLIIAACLVANTIIFAFPIAYRMIKNEMAWMELERERRTQEEKELERLDTALKMCTKERVELYNAAFESQGRDIKKEITDKLSKLPNEGFVPGTIQLYSAKYHHNENPLNVDLPLSVSECINTWPDFPKIERYAKAS